VNTLIQALAALVQVFAVSWLISNHMLSSVATALRTMSLVSEK